MFFQYPLEEKDIDALEKNVDQSEEENK